MTVDAAQQVESALSQAHQAHRAGQLYEARTLCLQALKLQPRRLDASVLLGLIAAQTGDLRGAVALFDQVLRLDPRHLAALHNRANALRALRQPAAALASYDQAIAAAPEQAPVHNGRGKALFELGQFEEAVASHERAIALQPDHAPAHLDRAAALNGMMRYEEAIAGADRAIALRADLPGAWHLRANALYAAGRLDEALQSYDRAIARQPDDARAHHNRGNALLMLERYESAIASYDEAIALAPDLPSSRGERLHARMHIADWRNFAPEVARLTARIQQGRVTANPVVVLSLSDSAALQRQAAGNWVRERYPPSGALPALSAPSRHEKVRVGYFSADFHGHASASLAAELFEIHDRSRLELTAFSLGPRTPACDRFLDVRAQSDAEIARLARSLNLDIAVDLGGFTRGGRPGIFALRAAPVQVRYLGYPGTMSADYMDYLIADDTIIPASHRRHYAEKIAYLPSYPVNDSRRRIADRRFGREELGLPAAGFVFCCFNSTHKITPDTFDGWMRILQSVAGSVLFLLGGRESLASNLRREARERGVDPQRIVFGARLPAPEYMARYRAADLFLDTLPYNAGTTASDALWAGLPVLTCTGETFASRVGASLLQAVGLPELITSSREEYERRAVELASEPQTLAGVRTKLDGNLRTTLLFDTPACARHLEEVYARMRDRCAAGLPPEHITGTSPP